MAAVLHRDRGVFRPFDLGADFEQVADDLVSIEGLPVRIAGEHYAPRGDIGLGNLDAIRQKEHDTDQRAQLAEVVFATAIDQCVFEHPTEPGSIRPQRRARRQRRALQIQDAPEGWAF